MDNNKMWRERGHIDRVFEYDQKQKFRGAACGYLHRSSVRKAGAVSDVNDGEEVENSLTLNELKES